MVWNIPNILTVLRLLAAPGVALVFLVLARPLADWLALGLFIGAALTDFLDGYLARAWNQQTKFGAMLDPIADKAMVVVALLVIAGQSGMSVWVLLPAVLIVFREVFVSGLREFLGAAAGTLQVTALAKWKTTVQMVAIAVLLSTGIFAHLLLDRTIGMDASVVAEIFAGGDDPLGLRLYDSLARASWWGGVTLLWLAAGLTLITGWDYFRKALPHLVEEA